MSGFVRTEANEPIERAEICALHQSDGESIEFSALEACVRSNAGGEFQIEVGSSTNWLLVNADGFRSKLARLPLPSKAAVEIVLTRGLTLHGRVIDALGGVVAGAQLMAVAVGGGPDPLAAGTARADGSFELGVVEGQFEVRARAPGYGVAQVTAFVPGPNVTLALAPAGRLSGVVVDGASAPVPGVFVRAVSIAGLHGVHRTVANASGEFELPMLAPGSYRVFSDSPDWTSTPVRAQVAAEEETRNVTLVVTRAASVSGQVLVRDEPCQHGEVVARGAVVAGAELLPNGVAVVGGLKPGRYELTVRCRGALPWQGPLDVTLEPSPARTWNLDRGRAVRGDVKTSNGEPRPGLLVRVRRAPAPAVDSTTIALQHATSYGECSTNDRGEFSCAGLTPGQYLCSLHRDARELLAAEVTIDERSDAEVHMILPPNGAIHVTDNVPVDVVATGPVFVQAERAPDGSSWLRDLTLGTYAVRYSNAEETQSVNLVRDGQIAELSLGPLTNDKLQGSVVDAAGAPIPDAWVVARLADAFLSRTGDHRALTDALGHFEFAAVPRGNYRLKVESLQGTATSSLQTGESAVIRVTSAE